MKAKLKSRDYPYDGESKVKCKCSGGIVILSGAYGWWEYKRNLRASGGKIQEENGSMELGRTFSCLIKDIYIYRYVCKNLDLSPMEYTSNTLLNIYRPSCNPYSSKSKGLKFNVARYAKASKLWLLSLCAWSTAKEDSTEGKERCGLK